MKSYVNKTQLALQSNKSNGAQGLFEGISDREKLQSYKTKRPYFHHPTPKSWKPYFLKSDLYEILTDRS